MSTACTATDDGAYESLFRSLMPAGWQSLRDAQTVLYYRSAVLQTDGPIIGLSATTASAEFILRAVAESVHRANGAPLGIRLHAQDAAALQRNNAINAPRSSSGLLVEIFPASRMQLQALLDELLVTTATLAAPSLLAFSAYGGSTVVHYRHGTIAPRRWIGPQGESPEPLPQLSAPRSEMDLPAPQPGAPSLLGGRFEVRSAAGFTNFGGSYRGWDMRDDRAVIIKEARPHVGVPSNCGEAIDLLRHEHWIFRRLNETGRVARAIAYFEEGGHAFLVREAPAGRILTHFVASHNSLILSAASEADHALYRKFIYGFVRSAIALLMSAEERGVTFTWIAPAALRLDASGEVVLVSADQALLADAVPRSGDPQAGANIELTATSRKTLGTLLLSIIVPAAPLDALGATTRHELLRATCGDLGLDARFAGIVAAMIEERPLLNGALAVLMGTPLNAAPDVSDEPFVLPQRQLTAADIRERALTSVLDILDRIARTRSPALGGSTWRAQPHSYLYGAFGALSAAAVSGMGAEAIALCPPVDPEAIGAPAGLAVGAAGMAWALCDLGLVERARDALAYANANPDRAVESGIAYGVAGLGMANLRLWLATRDSEYLTFAQACAELLCRRAVVTEAGLRWEEPDANAYLGLLRGGAGIALFLLYVAHICGDADLLAAGISALRCERAAALELSNGTIGFPRLHGTSRIALPYLDAGTAGFGSVLLRYVELAGAHEFATDLECCFRSSRYRYSVFTGWARGLAGIASFHLDGAFFRPGDPAHPRDAAYVLDGVLLRANAETPGALFAGEDGTAAYDFATGAAGIALVAGRFAQNVPTFPFLEQYGLGRAPAIAARSARLEGRDGRS